MKEKVHQKIKQARKILFKTSGIGEIDGTKVPAKAKVGSIFKHWDELVEKY